MYAAPVSEIAFTLKHVAGLGDALAAGRFPALSEDLVDAVLAEAGRFGSERMAPLNRVGDLDSAAVPFVMKTLGLSLAEVERQMTKESGLLGLSGVSNDLRDILAAATQGNARARGALDVFIHSIRHWIGAYLVELGGCDALVFTAGIGENNPDLRTEICAGLGELGVQLDATKNAALKGAEGEISAAASRTKVFVIPANEELVVARETLRCIAAKN